MKKQKTCLHLRIFLTMFLLMLHVQGKECLEKIQNILVNYWSNITLLEVAKNKFVPLWTYQKSTSWGTLNQKEKEDLEKLFEKLNTKNEKLWQKQASQIFTALTSNVKMIPCGEDLGVGIACVPETMKNHDILGLRVVRWCRYWEKENQPFVAFKDYDKLSVVTTSVHDSSTLRQWWADEKESVLAFTYSRLVRGKATHRSPWRYA